jgi:hypothetical protein
LFAVHPAGGNRVDPVRYSLDSLGWYQFERLVQVLLKADLGLGIESWGGRGDYGRDAFSKGPLKFPARNIESQGPFVFQAKFVEGANIPGADYDTKLIDAVRSEVKQITERVGQGAWSRPRSYVLLTNSPLTPTLRKRIDELIEKAGVADTAVTLGGLDLSDMLGNNPAVVRAFPQMLSLRNLKELLEDIVNKETLKRSEAAIKLAADFVPVFVPTGAYNKTWRVLEKHHFAVLEGPPEMGKTAIAWMIALAQLANEWEAITCDDPADLFGSHRPEVMQVFIADDAFGRTEYDPTMGSKWEKQIGRVNTTLDNRHWLIWTSRRHILERARREMDLQGAAQHFPDPGDVLVTASQLSPEERGLMLYRHAKASGLDDAAKTLIRSHARSIVQDPSFTPERIRRFVAESLPKLVAGQRSRTMSSSAVREEIREALRNPTDRMVKSFRALGQDHKLLLVALLEQGHSPNVESLRQRFSDFAGGCSRVPFDELLDELQEGFIKL